MDKLHIAWFFNIEFILMQFMHKYDGDWQLETFVSVTTNRGNGHIYSNIMLHAYFDRLCTVSHHTDGTCLRKENSKAKAKQWAIIEKISSFEDTNK